MNIILIQPNINMKDTIPYLNHGLAYVAAAAMAHQCSVKLVMVDDLSWRNKSYLGEVQSFNPDAVFITAFSNQWDKIKHIAANLKKDGPYKIICGGPHVTLFPDSMLESPDIDAIVVGEGDLAVIQILQALKKGSSLSGISGVWTKNTDGSLNRKGSAVREEDLDKLPLPAYEIYERDIILRYPGITFSRGCPFDCTYCCNRAYSQLYDGKRVRHLTPLRAVEIARHYRDKFKPEYLNIDDDTFTKNPLWLSEFIELYKKEVALPFNCNARAETITPKVSELLKHGNCQSVSIGIESGNEVLRTQILNRRMKNDAIIAASDILHSAGLKVSTFNMVGLPDETHEAYLETVNINRRIRPDMTQITVYYPYRGTRLGDYCYENGIVNDSYSAGSYFGTSILKLNTFPKWQIIIAARTFKFRVYVRNNFKRACIELTKDIVKSLPYAHLLLRPYLFVKNSLRVFKIVK